MSFPPAAAHGEGRRSSSESHDLEEQLRPAKRRHISNHDSLASAPQQSHSNPFLENTRISYDAMRGLSPAELEATYDAENEINLAIDRNGLEQHLLVPSSTATFTPDQHNFHPMPGLNDNSQPPKRKRGRPRKTPLPMTLVQSPSTDELQKLELIPNGELANGEANSNQFPTLKRKRGRPRKEAPTETDLLLPSRENDPPDDPENTAEVVESNIRSLRLRKRPQQYSPEVVIETVKRPSRSNPTSQRKRGRPRKDTSAEQPDGFLAGVDIGFSDISGLAHSPRGIIPNANSKSREASENRLPEVNSGAGSPVLAENLNSSGAMKRGPGRPRKSFPIEFGQQYDFPDQFQIPSQGIEGPEQDEDRPAQPLGEFKTRFQNLLQECIQTPSIVYDIKTEILEKLTGKRRLRLCGLNEEYVKVHRVVEQTVMAGESNSMLIIGARGSGKTTLVETVVTELKSENSSDFHVIRLSGFIHTDDKLALREIWRQLGREMELDNEMTTNYADTLTSLLALLSHPSEFSETPTDQAAKAVIFILDEFDLFTSHPRQTLLYNLFDIAQAKKAPIAVLGLTARIDVVSCLEKRVKSRFSHRYVHISLPKTLGAYWEICKEGLMFGDEGTEEFMGELEGNLDMVLEGDERRQISRLWSKMLEALWAEDMHFKTLIQSLYYRTKSAPDFFAASLLPISLLSPACLALAGQDFTFALLQPADSKLHILTGLSELELALLIAAARLDIILGTNACNFLMAYDEYVALVARVKVTSAAAGATAVGGGARVWGKQLGLGAWERLADYELLVPALGAAGTAGGVGGAGGGAGARDVGRAGRMFRVDVGLEEIGASGAGLSSLMARWCKEI
ncbi:MAG: hypothetical protein M1829_005604 [Trizodia sp. TS-e1964]|nr:MAG: hypothetical protein M1829_005604 [Trizodia sp. TS-e1964]